MAQNSIFATSEFACPHSRASNFSDELLFYLLNYDN